MKQIGNVWFPDHERHFGEWMLRPKNDFRIDNKLTYQYGKQQKFYAYCKRFRNVADLGAHCGLWSTHMVKLFGHVHAFEPVAEHRECYRLNVTAENYTLYPVALGTKAGKVKMFTEQGSSGNSHIVDGEGDIEMRTLDSYELQDIDALKVDAEGYELYILQGGEETIKRCRPTIIVEQKPHVMAKTTGFKDAVAVTYLETLGYRTLECFSGDYFMQIPE